jgi:calcineurin-like phosphoesterase
VISRFLNMRPTRFEVAALDRRCDFVVADIDDETGRARTFEHLQLTVED